MEVDLVALRLEKLFTETVVGATEIPCHQLSEEALILVRLNLDGSGPTDPTVRWVISRDLERDMGVLTQVADHLSVSARGTVQLSITEEIPK
jgi:hypothetical protein